MPLDGKNQFFSFFDSIIKLDFCPGFVMIVKEKIVPDFGRNI